MLTNDSGTPYLSWEFFEHYKQWNHNNVYLEIAHKIRGILYNNVSYKANYRLMIGVIQNIIKDPVEFQFTTFDYRYPLLRSIELQYVTEEATNVN